MNTSASPRHPWKALAVVLTMFAVVHGTRAHAGSHDRDLARVHIEHAAASDADCPDADIDEDDSDEPAVDTFMDVSDGADHP